MTTSLVIDTSYGSTVGIVGREPIVETNSRTHVERLQVDIARAMSEAGLAVSDLDEIIVGIGPAPYTGLRAGIVTAKAIAFAGQVPLRAADVLFPQAAYRSIMADEPVHGADHLVLAVNDARRHQLYWALYDIGNELDLGNGLDRGNELDRGNGRSDRHEAQDADQDLHGHVRELMAMSIEAPADIVDRVNACLEQSTAHAGRTVIVDVVGHGAGRYSQAWDRLQGLGSVIDRSVLDCGADGLALFARCATSPAEGKPVEPLYLRRPDVSVPNPLKSVVGHDHAAEHEAASGASLA